MFCKQHQQHRFSVQRERKSCTTGTKKSIKTNGICVLTWRRSCCRQCNPVTTFSTRSSYIWPWCKRGARHFLYFFLKKFPFYFCRINTTNYPPRKHTTQQITHKKLNFLIPNPIQGLIDKIETKELTETVPTAILFQNVFCLCPFTVLLL